MKLLNENEAQFAILQGLCGAWAWQGLGPYEKSGSQKQLQFSLLYVMAKR
ncbi:hypothetical protein O9992_23420 [Vibrio lentus]|nr:hypothetical protein [Vibrio lentus]